MWIWANLRRHSAIDYRGVFQTELVKENKIRIFFGQFTFPLVLLLMSQTDPDSQNVYSTLCINLIFPVLFKT